MRASLDRPMSLSRVAIASVLLMALVATSGCSWFRKNNKLYTQTAENRPLEVPPDLDRPRTDGAMAIPASGSANLASSRAAGRATPGAASAGPATGFTVAGSRDDVFAKVDGALSGIAGVEVASRAKMLGVIDVNYQGSNFLVRVSAADAGAYVSAVDPRGLPASGVAPSQLIQALKTALSGN